MFKVFHYYYFFFIAFLYKIKLEFHKWNLNYLFVSFVYPLILCYLCFVFMISSFHYLWFSSIIYFSILGIVIFWFSVLSATLCNKCRYKMYRENEAKSAVHHGAIYQRYHCYLNQIYTLARYFLPSKIHARFGYGLNTRSHGKKSFLWETWPRATRTPYHNFLLLHT